MSSNDRKRPVTGKTARFNRRSASGTSLKKTAQIRRRKPKNKPPRRFVRINRTKLMVSFSVMVVLLAALILRLTYINATSSDKYSKQVLSQLNYNSTTIPYRRGDITDRNGTILATSEKVYNLILDPYVLTNSKVETEGDCVEPTLDALEKYFGLDSAEVKAVIDEDTQNRYRVLKKQLTYDELTPYYELINSEDEADKEISQYIKGIWFEDDYVRRYPYNTLACDVLGFTVSGNVGTYGIEQYYNDVLNGTNGREYGYLADEANLERTTIAPVNGENVMSTIDANIQRIVEDKIWEFNETIGSMNTSVIVMNPNNGEVLAMASYPVFNLNEPRDVSNYYTDEEFKEYSDEEQMIVYNELWRNFSISDAYEPGSTSKLFTVAAALDEDAVKTTDEFYCDGGEKFADGNSYVTVGCNGVHKTLDLSGALMKSCNDALMQVVNKLGKTDFIKCQQYFNFGQLTNIDLPGEASASTLLYTEQTMGPVELATCSFGQGYSATAIQVAAAFSSLVNGGSYYQPHIVKQISTESGSIVETTEPELVRTTVSKETSDWIKDALLKTVGKVEADGTLTQGTGSYAYIEGYTIGGKTGTSEKKPLEDKKCIASFISCAPVEDPQVVVYVVVDEPQLEDQGASYVASIMTRKIYEELLPYLQIFPNSSSDEEETQETAQSETQTDTGESQSETQTDTSESQSGTDSSGESQSDSAQKTDGTSVSSQVNTSNSTFVWPHLTDEEKDAVLTEYLGKVNEPMLRSDIRPGAEKIKEEREKKAEEEKAKESESAQSQSDESQSGESETDESQSDE